MKPTKILALPVHRRQWLYAVEETVEEVKAARSWREGGTLWEKAQLAQQQLAQKVQNQISRQWTNLKEAPDGSLKNRMYRLAINVLAREDVGETLLKSIPADADSFEVIYPSSMQSRGVRRFARVFLQQQEALQRCRRIAWGVAVAPMVPLTVLPLPALPLYYAGYRVYSHNKALQGARRLIETFDSQPGASAAVVAPASADHDTAASPAQQAVLHFVPNSELAALLHSHRRKDEPVNEETAQALAERFDLPQLPALLRRKLSKLKSS